MAGDPIHGAGERGPEQRPGQNIVKKSGDGIVCAVRAAPAKHCRSGGRLDSGTGGEGLGALRALARGRRKWPSFVGSNCLKQAGGRVDIQRAISQ